MITCRLMGGLGNQLFQIFVTIAHSIHNKIPFTFIYSNRDTTRTRPTYWYTLLQSINCFTRPEIDSTSESMEIVREEGFHYTPLPSHPFQDPNSDICLIGYFQSYLYFEDCYSSISQLLRLSDQKKSVRKNIQLEFDEMISMHFRIGDYKKMQDFHPVLPYIYYFNSLSEIIRKTGRCEHKVLYFCEKVDYPEVKLTIDQLKEVFPKITFIRADESIEDWTQLIMMSCCKNNIIANSTFSWWGAYFNSSVDKIVCYPDTWLGPALYYHNTDDLCPPTWTKIYVL